MVKEFNNMRNKKSNSYKPYDSSNSFVRRVTSRVSQLLPQPTSWLNRLLSREPEQAGPADSQDGDDEEVVLPPPSKRVRTVQTCTDFSAYHNSIGPLNTRRLEDKREEELSPIRSYKLPSVNVPSSSRNEDLEAPGPSGLGRHRFISSTPAVVVPAEPQPPHQVHQPKVNGDEGSESDSGSHASSFQSDQVDQEPRRLFNRNFSKIRPPVRQAEGPSGSLMRSKQLKLDLSSSSLSSSRGGRVSFDTTVFNSPFKGRLCGGLSVSKDGSFTESPFYRSNTTFGGSSSCNDSMLRTRSLHSEIPIVVQPTQPQRTSDNLGSATKKILKALEQFSTPMLDQSRRLQVRDRGLKRKVEVPYKELVIPQMPDLLRIKRRDARHSRNSSLSTASSLSSSGSAPSMPSPSVFSKAPATSAEAVASQSSSSQLSQRLLKRDDNTTSKGKAEFSVDRRPEHTTKCLPVMTGLPLTSLPKFDMTLVKPVSPTASNVKSSSGQWTFSKPISLSDKACSSIPLSKKFSQPLDADSKEDNLNKPMTNCVNNSQSQSIEAMTYLAPSSLRLKRKEHETVPVPSKPVISTSSDLKAGSVLDVLNKCTAPTPSELKSGSVLEALKNSQGHSDISKPNVKSKWECQGCYVSNDSSATKCVACEQPRKFTENKENSSVLGEKLKVTSNECASCLVKNKGKGSKCVECGQSNASKTTSNISEPVKPTLQVSSGFGDKFKPPAGSWECSVCLVQNKSADSKCASCSSDKPGSETPQPTSVKLEPPLSNLFKKPEGSWECDTCLVRNKSDVTSCVSCGTDKPGSSKPASQTPATFSFGIPAAPAAAPKFTFGVSSASTTESSPAKPSFSFGSSSVPSTSTTTPKFSFGIMSTASETKGSSPAVANSMFSNLKNNMNTDSKTSSQEKPKSEKNTDVTKSEPKLNFGIASAKDVGSTALGSNTKSTFGNVTTSSVTSIPSSSASLGISANTVTTYSGTTPANLPIFVNQISSTKSPVTSAEKNTTNVSNPMFSTCASSGSISSVSDKESVFQSPKPSEAISPIFGSSQNEVKPMVTSPVNKSGVSNPVISSDKPAVEAKTNLFAFGNSNTTTNKTFLGSNSTQSTGLLFNSTPSNSFNNQNTAAPTKPVFTFTSGFSSGADQLKTNSSVNAFGSQQPSQEQTNEFTFKPAEPAFTFASKSDPSANTFQFGNTASNHTNNFTSSASTNQFSSSFVTANSSPFSTQGSIFGNSVPQPAQTASFLFGASQSNDRPPPAPTFNFPSQSGNSAGNNVTGGFTFGQTPNSAPVQPPSFDPNIKPVFNFSGGQTPTFSAQTTPGTITAERKIRKAIRRATQK